ncbi:T9SS type A sorting domain-containing protein [Pedobacter xixiisoli]|uniref:Por secretion system C-terminal sorting domain-containing protein n=1 Tax=Pedobacter xixiisoli TaxID=1476464 RepID=A0A286AAN9_9SPHI|nr:T9SS type A sorting domain-containing protein [Pedobacter xixiisoli]SOD18974.1 Por secretion system C-terminal sorting domain-containing protein [Pedobacter xixiisoli]
MGGNGGTAVTGNNQPGNNGSTPAANRGHGGSGAGVSGLSSLGGRAGSDGIVIFTYTEDTVLPVSFKLFTAKAGANAINLHWQTTAESANSHFTIKRSTDGINFESFASVEAKGNSNETNSYNLADKKPNIGINYYQLAQVDYNGNTKILSTQSALFEVKKTANSSVYPNPFNSSVNANFEQGIFEKADLSDLSGKVLASIAIEKEQTNCIFKTDKFTSGIYFIKLSGKQSSTHKVIKP